MNFIRASYGQCVYEVYKELEIIHPEAEVSRVLAVNEKLMLYSCINSWVRRALDNLSEYPKEIFGFFDLLSGRRGELLPCVKPIEGL